MPLLNYTTEIPAEKTVSELHRILAINGAMAVAAEYNAQGLPVALSFKIATPYGPTTYALPCDVGAVLLLLKRQKVQPRYANEGHAARVGWRIIKDWTEAQLALVATSMATIDQVFLPYARTPSGETVYKRYQNAGMAGLMLEAPREV